VYTSSEYWRPWILDSITLYNMGGEDRPSRLVSPDFFACWDDKDPGHAVISRQLAASVGECAEHCRGDVRCLSWQWEFHSSQCSMSVTREIPKVRGGLCHSGEVTISVDRLLAQANQESFSRI
jgi:hypothetical protein